MKSPSSKMSVEKATYKRNPSRAAFKRWFLKQ